MSFCRFRVSWCMHSLQEAPTSAIAVPRGSRHTEFAQSYLLALGYYKVHSSLRVKGDPKRVLPPDAIDKAN